MIKKITFFSAEIFSHFLVIKTLDPDCIRIRMVFSLKMLETDPSQMNTDPRHSIQASNDIVYVRYRNLKLDSINVEAFSPVIRIMKEHDAVHEFIVVP